MTIDYEGRELEVDYVYLPSEECSLFNPGASEDVDVYGLIHEGEDIIDIYDEDEINTIKELILSKHISDDQDSKLENLL